MPKIGSTNISFIMSNLELGHPQKKQKSTVLVGGSIKLALSSCYFSMNNKTQR